MLEFYVFMLRKKLFPLNIFLFSRDLCEQSIEIMLTPEMIQVEFPVLNSKEFKKEK